MKKLVMTFTITTLLLCTACTNTQNNPVSTPITPEVVVTPLIPEVATPENVSVENTVVLKTGTWFAKGDGDYRYFFFNNAPTGSIIDDEGGIGLAFVYEMEGDKVIFHIGDASNNSPVVIQKSDENNATLSWEDGTTEQLTYVSADNVETFVFYTNDELCEMALNYYKTTVEEDTSDLMSAAQTNEDGTVTIQIYSNLDGHNSTADWYTIDRVTATGTNTAGDTIILEPVIE